MKSDVPRRKFMRQLGGIGAGLGTAVILSQCKGEQQPGKRNSKIRNHHPAMQYRTVGNSGIQVSAFSLGTGKCNQAVLRESLNLGINFFHTSLKYNKGNSIKLLGAVLKGNRDKVHIALKDNFDAIETPLKILDTDHVEFIMFARHKPDEFRNEIPEIKKQFLEWRDKGLVKYAGLTTHKHEAECVDIALEAGFFTCIMPALGPDLFNAMARQRETCRQKNISIIGMKTKGELEAEQYPAQVQTVLSEPAVCTVNKAVMSLDDLNAWTAAARPAETGFWNQRKHHFAVSRPTAGCQLCGECERACPNRVATADIIRCIRYYHDAEGAPEMAADEFNEMGCRVSLLKCGMCGQCERACPQRIPVRHGLKRAMAKWVLA